MNEKTQFDQEKKEWEKPQLIILTRGEPEEGVLATCKNTGQQFTNGTSDCVGSNVCQLNAIS